MFKDKRQTILLYITMALALLFALTSCSSEYVVLPSNENASDGEQLIRISAQIMERDLPATRADGVSDGVTTNFAENKIPALPNESEVRFAILYVYGSGGGLEKVIVYHNGHRDFVTNFVNLTDYEGKPVEVKKYVQEEEKLYFDLILKSGFYHFLMVANSKDAYRIMSGGGKKVPDPRTLKLKDSGRRPGITDYNRLFTDGPGMPMVAQADFRVPVTNNTSESDPLRIYDPVLDLERCYARIDFYLTTADKDGNYLDPSIAWAVVENHDPNNNQDYMLQSRWYYPPKDGIRSLLPTPGEWSRAAKGSSYDILGKPNDKPVDTGDTNTFAWHDVNSYLGDPYYNWYKYGYRYTAYRLKKVNNIPAIISKDKVAESMMYVMPTEKYDQYEYDEEGMPFILFNIYFSNRGYNYTLKRYRIPFYTIIEARPVYEIRRNTIYEIHASLKGGKVEVTGASIKYVVEPYEEKEVNFPNFQ